ncbi:MAG: hypothetical protein HYX71_11215 [Opitutae bacterium]|nr:hypothetical protein [Opitutae bacterium]
MLSLTKKSDAQPVVAPLWHTNFRNFDRLPDTKVVRTTFFINTAAGAAAIALLLWVGYREYRLYSLSEQIAAAQREIDSNAKKNTEALRLSQIFADEDKKFAEAEAFLKIPVSISEYVLLLGQSLPKEISIDFTDLRFPADPKVQQTVTMRGMVAGSRDSAAGAASSYVDLLRAHPRLGVIFDPITLDKLTPDASTGFMSIEISLKVKTEVKKP